MQIFAFGHKKFVGKDTFVRFVCEILRKRTKLTIQRAGFADKLKATTHLLYAWAGHQDPSYYEHNPKHKNDMLLPLGKTVRDLWIEFGNHCRQYDENIWVNPLLKHHQADILFITDLRYPNEVEQIKNAGGNIIKIENNNVVKTDDVADCALDHFTDWDDVITNNETLKELYEKAERWIEKWSLTSPAFS